MSAKYTVKAPLERLRIKEALLAMPQWQWSEKTEQNCDYRLDAQSGGQWLRVKQFSNGTLYIESSQPDGLTQVKTIVETDAAQPLNLLTPAPSNGRTKSSKAGGKSSGLLDIQGEYIGTDESGKGDYFGPLVIAGVRVTEQAAEILKTLGVMDSKQLNDKTMRPLSEQIIQTVGNESISVVEIGPKKYNELYARMKSQGRNLNHLLAWGHATVIENLLASCPNCTQAVADQFGSEHYIKSQLKDKGKQITLYQTHRAEANVGVAAASILARMRFVNRMKQLAERFGMPLSFGASAQVKAQAKAFITRHGREQLAEVAKLHFKTTQEL